MNAPAPAVSLGHNAPPADADPLLERLRTTYAEVVATRDALLGGCGRAPAEIVDEETAGKMADFVQKQIDPFIKKANTIHDSEKEPFLSSGRTVDGFWHGLIDDLAKWKVTLNARRKAYADKKAAEERRRREEEARRAREEEDRKRREAEEAAKAANTDAELIDAIAREEEAERARKAAEKAAADAAAKPAELGRTRGIHGGLTTLKQFWNFADVDRAAIDLEALRTHLPDEALDKAVRSWIKANEAALKNGTRLAGVRIFEDTRL